MGILGTLLNAIAFFFSQDLAPKRFKIIEAPKPVDLKNAQFRLPVASTFFLHDAAKVITIF